MVVLYSQKLIILKNHHLYFILYLHVGKHYNLSTSAKSLVFRHDVNELLFNLPRLFPRSTKCPSHLMCIYIRSYVKVHCWASMRITQQLFRLQVDLLRPCWQQLASPSSGQQNDEMRLEFITTSTYTT